MLARNGTTTACRALVNDITDCFRQWNTPGLDRVGENELTTPAISMKIVIVHGRTYRGVLRILDLNLGNPLADRASKASFHHPCIFFAGHGHEISSTRAIFKA